MEEQTPCISIPHKELIGLGFFIHELCLLVQNFIFLCHSTITTFHFSSGKKKSKVYINTFVKGMHFTSNTVCRQESPAAGLTWLCLGSPPICMSYYNGCSLACRGSPARGGETDSLGGRAQGSRAWRPQPWEGSGRPCMALQ